MIINIVIIILYITILVISFLCLHLPPPSNPISSKSSKLKICLFIIIICTATILNQKHHPFFSKANELKAWQWFELKTSHPAKAQPNQL